MVLLGRQEMEGRVLIGRFLRGGDHQPFLSAGFATGRTKRKLCTRIDPVTGEQVQLVT